MQFFWDLDTAVYALYTNNAEEAHNFSCIPMTSLKISSILCCKEKPYGENTLFLFSPGINWRRYKNIS